MTQRGERAALVMVFLVIACDGENGRVGPPTPRAAPPVTPPPQAPPPPGPVGEWSPSNTYTDYTDAGGHLHRAHVDVDALAETDNYESRGARIMLPYEWEEGEEYRFTLSAAPHEGGYAWRLDVNGTLIGHILGSSTMFPARPYMLTWGEDMHWWDTYEGSRAYRCEDMEPSSMQFLNVRARGDAGGEHAAVRSISWTSRDRQDTVTGENGYVTKLCASPTVEEVDNGVQQPRTPPMSRQPSETPATDSTAAPVPSRADDRAVGVDAGPLTVRPRPPRTLLKPPGDGPRPFTRGARYGCGRNGRRSNGHCRSFPASPVTDRKSTAGPAELSDVRMLALVLVSTNSRRNSLIRSGERVASLDLVHVAYAIKPNSSPTPLQSPEAQTYARSCVRELARAIRGSHNSFAGAPTARNGTNCFPSSLTINNQIHQTNDSILFNNLSTGRNCFLFSCSCKLWFCYYRS